MDHKTRGSAKRDRDARVQRTRAVLRDTLVALLAEHPLAAITARMVTQRSRVGYATFFRHYDDVEALMSDVAATMILAIMPSLLPLAARGDARGMATQIVQFVANHRDTCSALLVSAGERTRSELIGMAVEAANLGSLPAPDWLPRKLAIAHQIGATLTTLAWWLEHSPDLPVEKASEAVYRLALEPTLSGPTLLRT